MSQEPELSVLLIEDEPDAARLVTHVLSKGSSAPLSVDWAGDLCSGLERLAERSFQAVLLDLNLPDSSGFETFARVREQAADQAVIVLTAQEDEALALQAVRAGADEYLIKSDIRERFLAQRVRHAVERKRLRENAAHKAHAPGKIFPFFGTKGGAGTTTLVLNVAAALARQRKSVVAMELVPEYGSFAAHLEQTPSWDSATLFKTGPEAITREALESCLTPSVGGFRALFGPQRPEDYAAAPAGHARALLRTAATVADWTVIDLGSSLPPAIGEIVQHAAFSTLVVERDPLGLHAASVKLPLLRAAGARDEEIGIALVDKTPHVERVPAAEFARRLGCGIVAVIPASGDQLAAHSLPLPLVLNRPDSPFAESIRELANRLTAERVRFCQS